MKRFSEECVVRIWHNQSMAKMVTGTITGLLKGKKPNVGHASITMRGPLLGGTKEWQIHLSWWPGGDGSVDCNASYSRDQWAETNFMDADDKKLAQALYDGKKQLRPGQKVGELTYMDDTLGAEVTKIVVGKAAENKIYIPGIGRAGEMDAAIVKEIRPGRTTQKICPKRYWGLAIRNMAEFLTFMTSNQVGFDLLSKTNNCSGMAHQALLAGGAEAYAPAPTYKYMALPNEVAKWTEQIADRINQLDRKAHQFETKGLFYFNILRFTVKWFGPEWAKGTLWTHDAFLKFGGSAKIVGLKKALTDYHQYTTWSSTSFPTRLKAMVILFESITRNLPADAFKWKEPEFALFMLGKQIIRELNSEEIKLKVESGKDELKRLSHLRSTFKTAWKHKKGYN